MFDSLPHCGNSSRHTKYTAVNNRHTKIQKQAFYFRSYVLHTLFREICIHGSVHCNSILVRSNKMQQYAGIYLLRNYSTCFGCQMHPSSGEYKTVTVASGTATTFLHRGLIRPSWRKFVAMILWSVPEAAVTVLCTPDDGCDGHPKHVERDFAVNKYMLHLVASY